MMQGRFTGRHMAAILIAFFAIVAGVNFLMARLALSTFGGVVVENSYVASQHYNRWLDEARAESALGWDARVNWREDRHVEIRLSGVPAGAEVSAIARHPLGRLPDRTLRFRADGAARFVSAEKLPAGRWQLRISVSDAGRQWRHEVPLP